MSQSDTLGNSSLFEVHNNEEATLIGFCKQMLKARVFQGYYQERRYVESLKSYRDLIIVDNNESELKEDLKYIRTRLLNFYRNPNLWVGITPPDMIGAPAGTSIWTDVEGTPFGMYWFQIKTIRFKVSEIYMKVKPLRPVTTEMASTGNTSRENALRGRNDVLTIQNLMALLQQWKEAISSSIMTFLSQDITKENIFSAFRFIILLFFSLLTSSVEIVKFLGIFSLRFFVETRMFLHTATPIIFKIIDLISKVIGGFFMLLAMVWRDLMGYARNNSDKQMTQYNYRALPVSSYYANRRRVF